MAEAIPGEVYTGEVCKIGANWGFIKCDDASLGDMFLIPQTCHLWGRQVPPVGTRLKFTVVPDAKTGRPRADNVEPEDGAAEEAMLTDMLEKSGSEAPDAVGALLGDSEEALELANLIDSASAEAGERSSGVVASAKPAFGFIKQDNGESDMFVLPPIPPVGTRVTFEVITDPKTGKPRAENVQPVGGGGGGGGAGAWAPPRPPPARPSSSAFMGGATGPQGFGGKGGFGGGFKGGPIGAGPFSGGGARATGTVASMKPGGTFGFITQDSGDADMFVLPPIPPIGTKVEYDVVTDPKTGRPRAENVQPLSGGFAGWGAPAAYGGKGACGGPPAIGGGKGGAGGGYCRAPLFGDGGHGFGGAKGGGGGVQRFSPYGAGGGKSGPSQGAMPAALPPPMPVADGFMTGEVTKTTQKFGFIKQDSGEADMFVFPPACEAFGRELPPVGTRVQYTVVIDQKTGRPRADQVLPAE